MYDYGKLVYLDLNKTGSKFILSFFHECLKFELLNEREHEPVRDDYSPDAFHLISIRHPYSQYSSLFRYGLDKKGLVYQRLCQSGHESLYSAKNFNLWLSFVLDFRNAKILGEGYENLPKNIEIGFLSYRFLKLSLIYPFKLIDLFKEFSDPLAVLQKMSIVDHIIKNENLNDDLIKFAVKVKPDFFYQEKIKTFFLDANKVNTSSTKAENVPGISDHNKKIIEEKEYLLMRYY